MDYQYQPGARAPIDAGELVADNGKVGDYRYYLRVVEWCFCDPICRRAREDEDVPLGSSSCSEM